MPLGRTTRGGSSLFSGCNSIQQQVHKSEERRTEILMFNEINLFLHEMRFINRVFSVYITFVNAYKKVI